MKELVIDVRDYNEGTKLEGVVNIPKANFEQWAKDQFANENKDKEIYVFCASGIRAGACVEVLHNLGFVNAQNIQNETNAIALLNKLKG